MGKTLSDKVWDNHVVRTAAGEPDLLYIDLHLVHEVTSPQAFDGLRLAGRLVRRTELTMATEDHNTPTLNILAPIADPVSKLQVDTLRHNTDEFGVRRHSLGDKDQGVVHIIGPQLGLTQPGLTVVCGDSHTSTHGAFGALAFGIGTSEVEHVLATQTLVYRRAMDMRIRVDGTLPTGTTAKDLILLIISRIGAQGARGYVVEFCGSAVQALSMPERMTLSNMSAEMGAQAGLIAPDATTRDWLAQAGVIMDETGDWYTDDAADAQTFTFDAATLVPQVAAPHSPANAGAVTEFSKVPVQVAYIGACTGAKLDDLLVGITAKDLATAEERARFWPSKPPAAAAS